MGYLTAKQLAEKWGITERRIIKLCKENRIAGAVKNGKMWSIPEDTLKPSDKRNNISKYINTQKKVLIVNFNNQIGYGLISELQKLGYIVEGLYCNKIINKDKSNNIKYWKIDFSRKKDIQELLDNISNYYEKMVFIDIEDSKEIINKEFAIKEIAKKMNCESAIAVVNNEKKDNKHIEKKLSDSLRNTIGLRINSITINAPMDEDIIIRYDEIVQDIIDLIINFKNTNGYCFYTDGGYLKFNKDGRTSGMEVGKYYKAITSFFKRLDKNSYMWCASTMMDDEWTEEPLEMDFRVQNLEAANRGAKMDRIFIFSKRKIKQFKKNKTLQIYMKSNINTMFVDYDEIKTKRPELLDIVGEGWDGIDNKYLLVDMPCNGNLRGYISKNEIDVKKALDCFKELKKFSKDLKEILK